MTLQPAAGPQHTSAADYAALIMPRSTYTALEISARPPGKEKRSALHDVVHAFRAAHGFQQGAGPNQPEHYSQAVAQFADLGIPDTPAGRRLCEAIEQLSSPAGYAEVRQAGRARAYTAPLEQAVLEPLCREIRAALMWRESLERQRS